jgi:hypothetical protein
MKPRAILRSTFRITTVSVACLAVLVLILKALVTQPVLGSFPTSVGARSDPGNLRKHVEFLCNDTFPRNSDHPEVLDRAASYVADAMSRQGARVDSQRFRVGKRTYTNVVGVFGPEEGPAFIIGAHYDVFGELPGADDNASGVAGLLELSRLLGHSPPPVRVELVAYSLEEPPFFGSRDMGSAHHARATRRSDAEVLGMISLEMIGYFSGEQQWDSRLLSLLYPDRGDFVMVVGRWGDRELARFVKKCMRGASSIRVVSASTPRLAGMDASDHRNYWDNGFKAVMLTDTAYLRNQTYHTADDRPSELDYEKLALVVDGIFGVTMNLDRLAS